MNAVVAVLAVSSIAISVQLLTLPAARELQRFFDTSSPTTRSSTVPHRRLTEPRQDNESLARLVFGGIGVGIVWIGFAASLRHFGPTPTAIGLMSAICLVASLILIALARAFYSDTKGELDDVPTDRVIQTKGYRPGVIGVTVIALLAFGSAATLVALWHRMGGFAIPITCALGVCFLASVGVVYWRTGSR